MTESILEEFEKSFSHEELRELFEVRSPKDYEIFIRRLYQTLEAILIKMEESPKERNHDSEDRISVEIVLALSRSGYVATKDPTQGGHVDIHVAPPKKPEMKWYGEAKIWDGPGSIEKGLTQLLSRYATGRQSQLGIFIYFQKKGVVTKLLDWQEHLRINRPQDLIQVTPITDFILESNHIHKSGAQITVRHFGVNLDWSPE